MLRNPNKLIKISQEIFKYSPTMANLFKTINLTRQQIRFLPRFGQFVPDKPVATENIDGNEQASKYPKVDWKRPTALTISSAKPKPKPKIAEASQYTIDEQGNLVYTKMQNEDARINKIMSVVKTRNKHDDFILLEGKRLIKEALLNHCKLHYILFSRLKDVEDLKPYLPKQTGKLYKMPYREMQVWSDLTTNPGIMGVFKIPPSNAFQPVKCLPMTIICDNIREPNNLGAILRTSSGVGCEQLILTKGCANIWGSKVLRSACGAHFRLKISNEANWTDIKATLPPNSSVFIADNKTVTVKGETEDIIQSIPVIPYYSPDFRLSKNVVLIIGGETEGISSESYKLAKEFNGIRINVPLSNGVNSLNTGTALGIIAFEIKRQLSRVVYSETMHCKG